MVIKLETPIKIKINDKTYSIIYKVPTKEEIEDIVTDDFKKLREEAEVIENTAKLYKAKYQNALEEGDEDSYNEYYKKYKELEKESEKLFEKADKTELQLNKNMFYTYIGGKDADELFDIAVKYNLVGRIIEEARKEAETTKKK